MRILLAEDDPRMSSLLKRGFSEEGHVVDRAASGTKALHAVMSVEFDVMIQPGETVTYRGELKNR